MGSQGPSRIRIASASGSVTDRRHGFADLAKNENVDFIVGDWMSEYNMTMRGGSKVNSKSVSSEFETSFIESIEPALKDLAANGIKVAVNAGASDTKKLHDSLVEIIRAKSLNLTVAWIEGDEVYEAVQKALKSGSDFTNLTTGESSLMLAQMPSLSDGEQEKESLTGASTQSMHNAIWAPGVSSKLSSMGQTLSSAAE
jgi:hypothetical protein